MKVDFPDKYYISMEAILKFKIGITSTQHLNILT